MVAANSSLLHWVSLYLEAIFVIIAIISNSYSMIRKDPTDRIPKISNHHSFIFILIILMNTSNHIEVDCHFIREKVTNKETQLHYTWSEHQEVDIWQRVFHDATIHHHPTFFNLGMIDIHTPTWGAVLWHIVLCMFYSWRLL